ncbi:MAG: type II toxin-antitoxin system Phd/YefM family antitoxin [Verrucomicrobiota bacterium]|jgi:antitoxin (DNA-binding transcriptional repressor) of toxin-antitoxin stability system
MMTVNTHEAKTRLSALLALVEQKAEKILICRRGRSVAELSRAKAKKRRNRLAVDPSLRVQRRYDPVEPLSEEEFPARFR